MTISISNNTILNSVTIVCLFLVFAFSSCSKEWEKHYDIKDESVTINLWDTLKAIDEYSEFIKYLEYVKLDTLIKSPVSKTLFLPGNEAFSEYLSGDTTGLRETMAYHILPSFFMLSNINLNSSRRIETLFEKFVTIQNDRGKYLIDSIEIKSGSPAFKDGKYYEIEKVILPRPNLLEYLKWNNPPFYNYIKTLDSLVLDKEESKPVGFNEKGETVYSDSVTSVMNLFEEEYFPVSKEFRTISATLVLPDKNDYDNALDGMCLKLGGTFQSKEDIPEVWQHDVLLPLLLNEGVFGGLVDPSYFNSEIIVNVKGDTIYTDYEVDPTPVRLCSNGLIYRYSDFSVKDSLFLQNILEPEDFVEQLGTGRYTWFKGARVEGNVGFQPIKQHISGASNDTVVAVQFTNNFSGEYALTLTMRNVFPLKYRLVWRTQYLKCGIFSVYVNGKKIPLGLFQTEEYDISNVLLDDGFYSIRSLSGDYIINYPDEKGFFDLDGYVEDLTEFGNVEIKIEYKGAGQGPVFGLENGLSIDYIGLLPAPELN